MYQKSKVSKQHHHSSLGEQSEELINSGQKFSYFCPLSREELFGKKVETRKCKMNWTFMKVCDYEGKGGVVDGLVGASQTAWKTLFRLLHQA